MRARRCPSAFDPGLYLRLRVHGKLLLSGRVDAAAGPFSTSKLGRIAVRVFRDDYPGCQDVDADLIRKSFSIGGFFLVWTWQRFLLQHHHGKDTFQRIYEAVDLACHPGGALRGDLERVRDRARNSDERQDRQTDLGAAHEIPKEARLRRRLHGLLQCRGQLLEQEERAETFDEGDHGEIPHVKVINERLQVLPVVDFKPDTGGQDDSPDGEQSDDDSPEESDEDQSPATL